MNDRRNGSIEHQIYTQMESPTKRRRLSRPVEETPLDGAHHPHSPNVLTAPSIRIEKPAVESKATETGNIAINATSKLAGQIVAPFLAKHIPDQYAPLGGPDSFGNPKAKDSNTKYCYRHRPDLKCRRQADEPSMEKLQQVCVDSK